MVPTEETVAELELYKPVTDRMAAETGKKIEFFMPTSYASVVEGMLESGGWPLTVDEETLAEANRIARRETDANVGPTGSAGFAGALELHRQGALGADEEVAILFTGIQR